MTALQTIRRMVWCAENEANDRTALLRLSPGSRLASRLTLAEKALVARDVGLSWIAMEMRVTSLDDVPGRAASARERDPLAVPCVECCYQLMGAAIVDERLNEPGWTVRDYTPSLVHELVVQWRFGRLHRTSLEAGTLRPGGRRGDRGDQRFDRLLRAAGEYSYRAETGGSGAAAGPVETPFNSRRS